MREFLANGGVLSDIVLGMDSDRPDRPSYPRVERSIRVGGMGDVDPDRDCWLTRTPAERWAALEACREAFYGTDAVRRRLARVLEIARQS